MPRTSFPLRQTHLICAALAAALGGCGGGGEPTPVTLTPDAAARAASFQRTLDLAPTSAGPLAALTAQRDASAIAPSAAAAASAVAPATVGVLLEGAAGLSAMAALRDYTAPSSASPGLPKPRVEAILSANAVVGQVNAALAQVGARIVGMQTGNSRLTLELSGAGASTTPEALSQRLAYSRAFEPYQPPPPQVEDHQPLPDEPQPPANKAQEPYAP